MIKNNTYMGHALRIAVGITMLGLLLGGAGAVNAQTELISEPEFPNVFQMPGMLEANGTHFELNNSEYLNIALDSSEAINLTLESVPEMVTMHIESDSGATSTQINLGGFLPLTTYHKYLDDYHNHTAFTTDTNGRYTYTQDLSNKHLVLIQTKPSTKFINANATGGDCTSIGIWDSVTKTCTLTTDLTETVQIDSNGITLDGSGHMLTGSNTGEGVYLNRMSGVTIKNLNIKSFSVGIFLENPTSNILSGINASNNYNGIRLGSGMNNILSGINATDNQFGILMYYSRNNILRGINASNNSMGIYLSDT